MREQARGCVALEHIGAIAVLIPNDEPTAGRIDREFPRRAPERRLAPNQLEQAIVRIDGKDDDFVGVAAVRGVEEFPVRR